MTYDTYLHHLNPQVENAALRAVQLRVMEEERERAEILALGKQNQQAAAAQPPKKLLKKISSFFGSKQGGMK
jgi:hypothetical protein